MWARAAWVAIPLGSLITRFALFGDHGSGLWSVVRVEKIRVPLVIENVFVVDPSANIEPASPSNNGVYFGLTECSFGVFSDFNRVGEIASPCIRASH
jgi:hypothetical protein